MPEPDAAPHAVDIHVGERVRQRRRMLGLSQETLAKEIGLTFQQVQKYERGSNRISCSKLFEISRVLKVPVDFFFHGLPGDDGEEFSDSASERTILSFLATAEGVELAKFFPQIQNPKWRRKITELVVTLSEDE